ncbi:hypothetical protein Csa_005292 [Cucumis sativus]|nr:hypothetical protein Csa_005292 [Cucumis sativus]
MDFDLICSNDRYGSCKIYPLSIASFPVPNSDLETVGQDSATEHLKLTITLLHGKHGPHAWEQSGRLDPVGYNSIPSTSLVFSCTGTHDEETDYVSIVCLVQGASVQIFPILLPDRRTFVIFMHNV